MADLITYARALYSLPSVSSADATKVAALITAASRAVEAYCRRVFSSASYDEQYDEPHGADFYLRQYPVSSVDRIATYKDYAMTVRNTSNANQRATVQTVNTQAGDGSLTATGLKLTRVASGVSSSSTLLFTDYVTVTLMEAAITALGNGWTADAVEGYASWPSSDMVAIQGALDAKESDATLRLYSYELSDYEIEAATGRITPSWSNFIDPNFMAVGPQSIRVQYTAGYQTIPEDIQEATAQTVAYLYYSGRRDPGMKSERLGDYSYTLNESTGNERPLPESACALLSVYVNHSGGLI